MRVYAVDRTSKPSLLDPWRGAPWLWRARSVPLAAVRGAAEGTRVRVRARVRADATIEGALHRTQGVFRRLLFTVDGVTWVHERGVDFHVSDGEARALVAVEGGRMVVAREELIEYPAHCFDGLPVALGGRRSLPARERVLLDGEFVDIVGHKTMTLDPSADPTGYRELPQQLTLRGSREHPLLILPVA